MDAEKKTTQGKKVKKKNNFFKSRWKLGGGRIDALNSLIVHQLRSMEKTCTLRIRKMDVLQTK